MAHTGKSPTRPTMEPLRNDYELTGPLRPHLSSGNLTAVFQTVGDPRALASTGALFPGRFLLVPHCLNSCTGGWPLLDGFLRRRERLRSSWHKGVTKRTWECLPMVLSLLQGNLAQMPAQRDWLGLLFSKTKHRQAGEEIKGHCLARTEMQV